MKFKKGDYVKSIIGDCILEVMGINENSFQGKYITSHPFRDEVEIGDIESNFDPDMFELRENPNAPKVVKEWQDLIGLENGKGLKINNAGNILVSIRDSYYIAAIRNDWDFKAYLEFIKSMGFEFEYKPLRTVEEVYKDIEKNSISFKKGEENFSIYFTKNKNKYYVYESIFVQHIGCHYLEKETAEKYVNELNEIVRNKKK